MVFSKMRILFFFIIFFLLVVQGLAKDYQIDLAKNYNQVGLDKFRQKEYKSAELFFSQAIALNPKIKHYYNNLAVAYIHQKKYKKALDSLKICQSLDPFYAKALSNLALVSFHLFRFKEAYYYYQKAVVANRSYVEERFKLSKVIKYVEKTSEDYPQNEDLRLILGVLKKQ